MKKQLQSTPRLYNAILLTHKSQINLHAMAVSAAITAAITAVLCAFGTPPPIDTPAARHCAEATCSVVPWGLTVEGNSWDKEVSYTYLHQCMHMCTLTSVWMQATESMHVYTPLQSAGRTSRALLLFGCGPFTQRRDLARWSRLGADRESVCEASELIQ